MGSLPSGISGSRASAILGLNKHQSQFHVWQNIIEEVYPGFNASQGYTIPDNPDNAPIRWGNAFEDAVIELAEQADGGLIGEREKLYSYDNPKYSYVTDRSYGNVAGIEFYDEVSAPYITCHIDGRYEDGKLHEGKTTNIFTFWDEWGEPGTDKIPSDYQIQCQHQMLCSGADEVILSVLVFPKRTEDFEKEGWTVTNEYRGLEDYWIVKNDNGIPVSNWAVNICHMGFFHQYQIKANKKIQDKLLEIYSKWWQDHILGKKAPEPTCNDDLKRMLPMPHGEVIVEEDHEGLFRKYGKANRIIKRLENLKGELKIDILSSLAGDAIEDEDASDKIIFKNTAGDKLASYSSKSFRVG